jgi:hypothetical protein
VGSNVSFAAKVIVDVLQTAKKISKSYYRKSNESDGLLRKYRGGRIRNRPVFT